MKREYVKQQQQFSSFEDLIDAVSTTYTLSLKNACKALKCDRKWASLYIRPNIGNIYLPNGRGTNGANYAKLVSQAVNKMEGINEYSEDSVYLNEKEFESFLKKSITSCTKRSKRVYRSTFVKYYQINDYYEELFGLYSRFYEKKRLYKNDITELGRQIDNLYLDYAKNDVVEEVIKDAVVSQYARTEAEFVNVPVPDVPIRAWKAIHDMLDYGEVHETLYRDLFREGNIRIEIGIENKKNNKVSKKIYYIADPSPVNPVVPDEKTIARIVDKIPVISESPDIGNIIKRVLLADEMNIKQSAWFEYNKKLGHSVVY